MPLSAVQISNLALARIGILQGIDDLDEASDEARACSLAFEACRDEVLSVHEWPFSTRTAVLGLVATDPTDSWSYAYRLPSDYLTAKSIGKDVPFTIASDSGGGLLYCNSNPATLEYFVRIDDPALLPIDVAMLLVARLAVEIAPALSRTDAVVARAQQRYKTALDEAVSNRMAEPGNDDPRDAEAISGRE
jgi:hypothetical protein